MQKNLILFHMESIDTLHFLWNRELFPNIWKFAEKCINVKYHYSNSTSTLMTMNDILYGQDWYRFEGTVSYANKLDWFNGKSESLLGYFENEGYSTKIITYPKDAEQFNMSDVIWKEGGQKICGFQEEFFGDIERFVRADRFVLYIWDVTSHLNVKEGHKEKYKTGTERLAIGCKEIDDSFEKIIKILDDNEKMDNTVIILFGDHGDDYWFHGFEEGYAHGTVPYTNAIVTPLLIYDGGYSKGTDVEHILSDCDIGGMCKDLVNGMSAKLVVEQRAREYVFSRNLFAAQRRRKYNINPSKGFAISNRKYTLILNDHGYEMYYVNLDPQNSSNILDYFEMKNGELSIFLLYPIMREHTMFHFHFINLMNEDEIDDIKTNFCNLQRHLSKELNDLYEKGIDSRDKMRYLDNPRISYRRKHFFEIFKLFFRGAIGRVKMKMFGMQVFDETI